jgi:hypothetical protein
MRSSSAFAPREEPRSAPRRARPPPRGRDLARAALGPVAGAEVLVIAEDPAALGAGLAREGAHLCSLALGPTASGRPDAWRTTDLPTWHFDALLAEGLLSRAGDLDALLYRLRAWVRPAAPFALVEPVAPLVWDPRAPAPGPTLSAADLDLARRHLPGLRVTRLPPAEVVTSSWADALRTAVEPFIPGLAREVRLAVLAGCFPP